MTLPPRVQELAEQVAAANGVEVLQAQLRRQGRSRVLHRPLRTDRDFRRQRGHEVRITRAPAGADATASVQGMVVAVDERAVTLEVDGDRLEVPLSEVVRGTVVLPW